jgi:hypothetical protein
VQSAQFQPTQHRIVSCKKDNDSNFQEQLKAMVRFGPAIGIIILFVVTLHAQSVRALHTLTLDTLAPVRQGTLKMRRYIGLVCDSSHGNIMDAVAYSKTRRKPVCSM